jgi:hypothetical protein
MFISANGDAIDNCHTAADTLFRELQVRRMKSSPSPVPVHKQTVIFDVAGLSARPSSVGLSLFRTTIDIDSNYYPERLGHFFIINAGMLFRALWKVISLWCTNTRPHYGNFWSLLCVPDTVSGLIPKQGLSFTSWEAITFAH